MNSSTRGQGVTVAADGLPALSVAEHAKEKEHTLQNVMGIFTNAMKNKWPRLYYVDLFAGPGKCVIIDSNEETEGSPVIAARVPFTHYYFADKNEIFIDALKKRVGGMERAEKPVRYYNGQANTTIDEILKELPPAKESLGLAVLDPWGWDFSFASLRKLTRNRRIDILINFNIGYMKRNWQNPSQEMDSFLNLPTDHRAFFEITGQKTVPDARTLLDHYEKELEGIGYHYTTDDRPVTNSNNTPLYHIIFGSKHELGMKLKDAVSQKTASGQIKMLG